MVADLLVDDGVVVGYHRGRWREEELRLVERGRHRRWQMSGRSVKGAGS